MARAGSKTHGSVRSGETGFTLVELMVATSMMLIVFFAGLGLFEVAQRAQPAISSQNERIQSAQVGIERVARELRQTFRVVSASPTTLIVETFVPRTTCGGATPGTARSCRVTYACSAGSCTRTVAELNGSGSSVPVTFASDLITNNVFTYSPSSTAPTAITIRLAVRAEDGSSEDAVTLTDGAVLRNVSGAVGS